MKKYFAFALACLLVLAGCAKNLDNIPSKELVLQEGVEWAEEKLNGYTPDDLREVWGEPDGMLSGMWGEIWFVDEYHTARVTVYYDANGKVENVRLDTAPGLEPAPDPIPEPEPEPETYDLKTLESPPELKGICGGEELRASSCGFTWVTEHGILCADAPAPLQMKEQMTKMETAEGTAVLEFEVQPDEVYVHAWDDNCTPECDGLSQTVAVRDGGEIELIPGGYVYEVVAKWGDGETAGGTGRYAFYIDKLYPHDE